MRLAMLTKIFQHPGVIGKGTCSANTVMETVNEHLDICHMVTFENIRELRKTLDYLVAEGTLSHNVTSRRRRIPHKWSDYNTEWNVDLETLRTLLTSAHMTHHSPGSSASGSSGSDEKIT